MSRLLNRRSRFALTASCTLLSGALAAPAAAQQWQEAIGNDTEQRTEWTDETSDGGHVYCGFEQPGYGVVGKLDANGTLLWSNVYDGPFSFDVFNRVQETIDGSLIVAGETTQPTGSNFGITLTKLNAGGNVMWSRIFPGTPFAGGTPGGVAVDEAADRGYYIAGRIQGEAGAEQGAILIRTNSLGQPLWIRYYIDTRFMDATFASFYDVHAMTNAAGEPDGCIVSGFTSDGLLGDRDSLLMRIDEAGNVLWSKTYGHTGHYDWGSACDPAANGDFLMSGFSKEIGEGGGTYLLRTDSAGNLLWHRNYRLFSGTSSMLETPSGDIALAGNANDFAGFDRPAILETSSTGAINWCMAYGSAAQGFGEAVVPTSDNGYHLVAWANPLAFGDFDLYSVKTDGVGSSGCDEVAWNPLEITNVPPVKDIQMIPRDMQGFEFMDYVVEPVHDMDILCVPDPDVCTPAPGTMVAWWPFDTITAAGTPELIYGNDAVPTAGIVGDATEYVAGSACFDGASWFDVADDPAHDFGTGDFSVDFWIKPTGAAGGVEVVMDKRVVSGGSTTGWEVYLYNNQIGLQIGDGAYTNWTNPVVLPSDAWTFVAITVRRADPNGIRFYLDGALSNTYNPTAHAGSIDNAADLRIGCRYDTGSRLTACLDEIELFKRVLAPTEINAIYAADTAGKCKDLCLSDLDGDGVTGFGDLLAILSSWGPCPGTYCPADLDGDGVIGFSDIIIVLTGFGPCP